MKFNSRSFSAWIYNFSTYAMYFNVLSTYFMFISCWKECVLFKVEAVAIWIPHGSSHRSNWRKLQGSSIPIYNGIYPMYPIYIYIWDIYIYIYIYTISTNSDVDKELGILGFQNLVFPPFPSMVYHNTPLKGLPFVFAIHNWTSGIWCLKAGPTPTRAWYSSSSSAPMLLLGPCLSPWRWI